MANRNGLVMRPLAIGGGTCPVSIVVMLTGCECLTVIYNMTPSSADSLTVSISVCAVILHVTLTIC